MFLAITVHSQDIHYSQIGNSPQNLNPGMVGVFNGNHRFIGNFRNQWQAVSVPYLQLAASYDQRFTDEEGRPKPFAFGLNFNYDRAGDLGLSSTNLGLAGSYSMRVIPNKNHFFSAGLAMGVIQRRFDASEAILDEQYDFKTGVDLALPVNEVFDNTTRFYPTFSVGGNLRLQPNASRSKYDIGIGVYNFHEPDRSFQNGPPVRHETRFSLAGAASLQLADKFDLLLQATGQLQGEYQELAFGIGGLLYLSQAKTKELALQLGIVNRLDDAIIPWVGVHWTAWQFHLSYDLNISNFNQATNNRGGPEISVIYIIKNVLPMEYCALCPKYM